MAELCFMFNQEKQAAQPHHSVCITVSELGFRFIITVLIEYQDVR